MTMRDANPGTVASFDRSVGAFIAVILAAGGRVALEPLDDDEGYAVAIQIRRGEFYAEFESNFTRAKPLGADEALTIVEHVQQLLDGHASAHRCTQAKRTVH